MGLRKPERGEPAPRRELGQPAALLLLGAEERDRGRTQRRVRSHRHRQRRVDTRELLDRDRVRDRVRPPAAVLLRDGHPHQPELGKLRHELVREAVLPVELLRKRRNAGLGELANGAPEELVLLREIEVHLAGEPSSTVSPGAA
jgi:hypothetical protein